MKMEEKEIRTISKEEIRQQRLTQGWVSYNGCYITRGIPTAESKYRLSVSKYPHRIESFVVMICKRGRAKVTINLDEHEISDNCILFNTPNNIIQVVPDEEWSTQDGNVVVMSFDEKMGREVNFDLKLLLSLGLLIKEQPVMKITPAQCDQLMTMISQICDEINTSEEITYRAEVIRHMFLALFYKITQIMDQQQRLSPTRNRSVKNRNEEYFSKFLAVLGENYRRERGLSFYASQLCITPKYLTTLIKKVSGRSASEWIDQYVILEAKNLLRYSSLSIQEVAYELNFPNQSFFGKYFKHHTGYSPSAYKLLK